MTFEIINPPLAAQGLEQRPARAPAAGRLLFVAGSDRARRAAGLPRLRRPVARRSLDAARRGAGRRRHADRHRAHDGVRDRQGRLPRRAQGARRGMAEPDGQALSGDGAGRGDGPWSSRRPGGDRGHRGDSLHVEARRYCMPSRPQSFLLRGSTPATGVATITLNRPERLNALTFEVYAELRDTFRALDREPGVRAVIITGAGRAFCTGGDVEDIIGPLFEGDRRDCCDFTRLTCDLILSIRQMPPPGGGGAQRHGGRRGGGDRGGERHPRRDRKRRRSPSYLSGWGCRAPTWGRLGCCRGSSGRRATELLMLGTSSPRQRADEIGLYHRVVPTGDVLPAATALAGSWRAARRTRWPSPSRRINHEAAMDLEAGADARGGGAGAADARPRLPRGVRRLYREAGAKVRVKPDPHAGRPFLEPHHAGLAARGRRASAGSRWPPLPTADTDAARRGPRPRADLADGRGGWLEPVSISTSARCASSARRSPASPLADAVFALQALGTTPILLGGSDAQKAALAPRDRRRGGDGGVRDDRARGGVRRGRASPRPRAARRRRLRARRHARR